MIKRPDTAALAYHRAEFGKEITPTLLQRDPELRRRWTDLKAQTLVDFSVELAARVRQSHPNIKLARNIFASALLDDAGTEYVAQDYDAYLRAYDYVALMAMPALEGATDDAEEKRELLEMLVIMDSDAVWDVIDSTFEE